MSRDCTRYQFRSARAMYGASAGLDKELRNPNNLLAVSDPLTCAFTPVRAHVCLLLCIPPSSLLARDRLFSADSSVNVAPGGRFCISQNPTPLLLSNAPCVHARKHNHKHARTHARTHELAKTVRESKNPIGLPCARLRESRADLLGLHLRTGRTPAGRSRVPVLCFSPAPRFEDQLPTPLSGKGMHQTQTQSAPRRLVLRREGPL